MEPKSKVLVKIRRMGRVKIFVCVNFLLCTSFAEQTKSRDKLNLNKVSPIYIFFYRLGLPKKRERKVVEYFLPEFENISILLPGFEEVFKNLLAGLEEEEESQGAENCISSKKRSLVKTFLST